MATVSEKLPINIAGKYFTDSNCIDCDACRSVAPDNFRRDESIALSYVYKQPETPMEEQLCREAMEGCPVEAIGADGV